MPATTHAEFNANTEASEVAKAFAAGIRGKTIMVTGVNRGGIGFSTAQAFASQNPACLIVTGRSPAKIQGSIGALRAEFPTVEYRGLQVDLSLQKSVRDAADEVLSWTDISSIDIVVNSAGVWGVDERTLTQDGIEMHLATNHLGHWLLTCLIMPKLITAAGNNPPGTTRIVNVTSASPQFSGMRWSDMNFVKKNKDLPAAEQPNYEWFKMFGYTGVENLCHVSLDGYSRSKVANVLFGIAANKRLLSRYGILTVAVHPGIIETELGRNFEPDALAAVQESKQRGLFSTKTLGAGASTSLVAALDPLLAQGVGESKHDSENWGSYLDDCQISGMAHPLAVSSEEAEKLWDVSEKLAGQAFSW
ncbi:NAD(P)-binding protein [Penicillium hispanicum]|uniref:NAD(P)-binding protein n=1 Tax=Penicillium hispanicum TaxID=1080232 RepID=UPI0025414C77|nr:NAD(P)-binding protein [Penicillium hispanicum]KAJ5574041.1 NAD(P)-binding protein [Penicillium hispanicum]